ncbi:acylphosphatase [Sphingobium yanoikuyae]|jgi:acylphosphatase|uniref:acylphosphatase n=1 Tax=Sphingobium yanoikuyae TaxID=13690 RepID=A0A0J9FWI3_SPHYA|nr:MULTISPECIES: acylphosphatase [Sphingobium]ATP19554.1 acylphosphatase [Sphingobium yanoikuyae]KMW32515.1 acylphosphatase [Sphingobium yanoikuyae]MDH2133040.1 acylphosphatase [Sphingobium yanoikuyae]MDH2153404.1 acylphosphatase [Sphingobium yanoikuyae]MDH2169023.1 acylphosphatase [Sphingobium yanoikuyae]
MLVIARHLMILGQVQGVFYRNWTVETARSLGLTGWVRNRMDGSVEALVQGEADMVDHFVTLAQDGPPAAKVARIEAANAPVEALNGFEKKPTA